MKNTSILINTSRGKTSHGRLRIYFWTFLLVYIQCCGAGAGGAEIILGPGAGAENKF